MRAGAISQPVKNKEKKNLYANHERWMLIQLALHETLNRCYVITDKPKQVIEEESMQTPKQRIPTTTCRVCILRRDGFHKKRLTRRIL